MHKPWKEAGLGLLNLVAVIVVVIAVQPVLHKFFSDAVGAAVLALLVLATYIAASKWIERRTLSELSISQLLPEISGGLAGGLALFATVIAILWIAGVYHPGGRGAAIGLASGFAAAVAAGVIEETLFRGLLFRLSSKIVGTWGALLLTAILFGAAHAFNRGATFSSSLAIALEAGILLGAAYAATQRLWVPIGLHIGWNFAEGSIFSMSVSGNNIKEGVFRGSLSGPQILTGGQFGPEASIIAVIVCLAAALYFIGRMVKRNLTEPPAWSKQQPARSAAAMAHEPQSSS